MSMCPRILFVDSKLPNTTAIFATMPPNVQSNLLNQFGASYQGQATSGANFPLPTAINFPAPALPSRWIDYSSLDIVCMSLDQLADLAEKNPAAFRAILEWTNAGGNLWVYGIAEADGPWTRLGKLEKLLNIPSTPKTPDLSEGNWIAPGDENQDIEQPNEPLQGISADDELGNAEKKLPPVKKTPVKNKTTSLEVEFLVREYGMGSVTVISSKDPFSGNSQWLASTWSQLLNLLGSDRYRWNARHGINMGLPNSDFWQFLIPGVGLAPVHTFQVFITLFVLGIGPFNYWLLKRKKRLYLIVLTVPFSALLVTGMLFSYAIVADGLGIRVRARSITRLDQRRGEIATWTRLSYYAGLAPSKGLAFSARTAVYPISDLDSAQNYDNNVSKKNLVWENDQKMTQGWLDARTPTQYLTVRSGPSARRLEISESSASEGTLPVENRLDTPIEKLFIRGHDGKFYFAENIGKGAKAQVKETKEKDIHERLRKLILENQLSYPAGIIPYNRNSVFSFGRYAPYYYQGNLEQVGLGGSLMEHALDRVGKGDLRLFNQDIPLLRSGVYIALVPQNPEVELGTESAREEAGFHLIVGEW
jgi:hypothetical protein